MTGPSAEAILGFQVKMMGIIDEVGWAVQGVFDPHGMDQPFVYTVGLSRTRGYEFALVGLEPNLGAKLLNDLADLDGESPIVDGQPISDLLGAGMPAVVMPMESIAGLNMARSLFGEAWRARQVLWPDPAGRLPTDAACDAAYVDAQRNPEVARWYRP